VLANFRPRELWIGANPPTPALQALFAEAKRLDIAVIRHTAGDVFRLGDAQVQVLAPAADWRLATRPRNNDSLAIKVTFGATSALLAGDVEKSVERRIAQLDARADVLKVAHHGSATSTTPELLAATQPRFAVISAGPYNHFGHPRPEVLRRLAAARVATFRTDTEGAITFYLNGRTVQTMLPSLR
jgi:competence protein ComEC